jgi:ankyrin repeat protein
MRLLRYNNFTKETSLNENIDQAKKILRDTYKMNKAVLSVEPKFEVDPSGLFLFNSEGDPFNFNELPEDVRNAAKSKLREIKVTPDENSKVERGEIMKVVRDIVGDKLGYASLFTYLLLVERIPVDDLKDILSKLVEYRDLLAAKNPSDNKPLLRRPISNYIDTNIPNNGEQLVDDLENINLYKSTKKVYNELTPILKKDYDDSPPVIKKQVDDLALAFAKIGMKDGKVDKNTQERLWKLFFGEMKTLSEDTEIRGKQYKRGDKIYSGQMVRFKNIRDFIKSAQNYIKNIDNTETVKFYEAIEKCNEKYGSYGVQVCFDEANILILEVRSFQANQMMNSHTRHCIKDNLSSWDSYVGGENKFTKQYYIYNFNLPSYDTKSVIGITIETQKRIGACHLKDDAGYSNQFKSLLNQWEKEYGVQDLWQYFEPMDPKEVEAKRKRVVANREVVKKEISLERVRELIEQDGADVNAGKGAALDNAVSEGNLEKVKFLLEYGASPNLKSASESTINKIADFSNDADPEKSAISYEMLKLMIKHGAELTSMAFKAVLGNFEAVKFCLDNGMDPNLAEGMPSRLAVRRNLTDMLNLLLDSGADVVGHSSVGWAYEDGFDDILNILFKRLGKITQYEKSLKWIATSWKIDNKKKLEILQKMQNDIDEGRAEASDSGYRILDDSGRRVRATYDETVKKYGNLMNYFIDSYNLKK